MSGIVPTAGRSVSSQGEADREGACKSMNRAQEQKHHLALANRQIAELTVQIVRQRVIVKHALDTGQRAEMAESLLDALERKPSHIREAPDIFAELQRQRVCEPSSAPTRAGTRTGGSLARRNGCGAS